MDIGNIKESCGALIYCTTTQRYLFLLRNGSKFANTWGLAGGKLEDSETMLVGLIREIREELGGEISGAKVIPIEKYTSDNGKFAYHTFLIKIEEEFVPQLNREHKGYCWVGLEDHPSPLHPGVYRTLTQRAIRNKLKSQELIKD